MTNTEKQERMAEELWLKYFNQTLYERGYITERERNRMKLRIEQGARVSAGRAARPWRERWLCLFLSLLL